MSIKRFYLFLLVMMMTLSVSAGVPQGGATGAEAADESSAQQTQKATVTPESRIQQVQEPVARPIPEKVRLKMEKFGQKLEKHQQKSSVKDGNGVHHATTAPLLTIGLVLILVGLLLFFLPGLGALGSLCVSVGAVLCIIALIIYLLNVA